MCGRLLRRPQHRASRVWEHSPACVPLQPQACVRAGLVTGKGWPGLQGTEEAPSLALPSCAQDSCLPVPVGAGAGVARTHCGRLEGFRVRVCEGQAAGCTLHPCVAPACERWQVGGWSGTTRGDGANGGICGRCPRVGRIRHLCQLVGAPVYGRHKYTSLFSGVPPVLRWDPAQWPRAASWGCLPSEHRLARTAQGCLLGQCPLHLMVGSGISCDSFPVAPRSSCQ